MVRDTGEHAELLRSESTNVLQIVCANNLNRVVFTPHEKGVIRYSGQERRLPHKVIHVLPRLYISRYRLSRSFIGALKNILRVRLNK